MLDIGIILFPISVSTPHSDILVQPHLHTYKYMCLCSYCAGGGVQLALRATRAPVQEAVRGPLPGLRQERQRHAGRLRGAGAAQDGRPDAGLRPVHISKSPGREGGAAPRRFVPPDKLKENSSTFV